MVILSALMFGCTPAIGKISYGYGNNPVMLSFLRSFLALPFLAATMKYRHIPFQIGRRELAASAIAGIFGTALTVLTLYLSYVYIPVGTATTLHFLYPSFVMLSSVVLFREHISWKKACSLILSLCGIVAFAGKGKAGDAAGIALAIFSAASYAFYTVFLGNSILKQMESLTVTFYTSVFMSAAVLAATVVRGEFTITIEPVGWLCSLVVSLLASVIGVTCFQAGVKRIGAVSTGMYSLLEPVSSLIVGILFLKEELLPSGMLGCVLILASLFLYGSSCRTEKKENRAAQSSRLSIRNPGCIMEESN